MNIQAAIQQETERLSKIGIDSARLDAELLLADVLQKDRLWLHSHPEHELDIVAQESYVSLSQQRAQHVPVAQITGYKEFYGRDFIVTKHTLVPRPESEDMITLAIELKLGSDTATIDLGTGTGCLGISYGLELKEQQSHDYLHLPSETDKHTQATIHLNDISTYALTTARQNARTYALSCKYVDGDFTSLDLRPFGLILANLPYVPALKRPVYEQASPALTHEPDIALYADDEGLAQYSRLFEKEITPGTHILTESLIEQHQRMESLAQKNNYELIQTKGLIQLFKKL